MKSSIILIAYFLSFPLFGVAQSYQSNGVVHDATGADIPGASVALLQTGSNLSRSSQTDDQGAFQIALPDAGTYQLEISASGFAIYRAQVILTPAAPSSNLDIALAIEGNSQTVEVTANALAAETTSTQLGESLDTKKIEAVPLNGRSFTDLMAVQPGIVPQNTAQPGAVIMTGVASTPPSGDANPGNLSISGQRESSNGFRVNGSDVEEDVNMGTSILPNLDAIDSFRVLTSNFDAEYGNSSGGQVLVTTKAGTAHTHGSAFEFLRNTAFDARNYFSQDRAAYRQNQFGGTLGGAPFRSKSIDAFWRLPGNAADRGHRYWEHFSSIFGRAQRRLQPEPVNGQCEWRLLGERAERTARPNGDSRRTVLRGLSRRQDSAIGLVGSGTESAGVCAAAERRDGALCHCGRSRNADRQQRRIARRLDARQGHADGLLLS